MGEKDLQRAINEWVARRKGEGAKDADGPPEGHPQGAVPFCAFHRWVPQADGAHLICADCGLRVARQMAP